MNATQTGFTLWELMIAVAVAGIVLGLGVPSFMELQRNNAMTAAANELVTGILMARAEAIKRQVPVTLCASADPTAAAPGCDAAGTNGGFIVFVDGDGDAAVDAGEAILLQRPEPGNPIDSWSDSPYIAFGPNGFPRHPAAQVEPPATRALYCDDRGNGDSAGGLSSARVVWIEATGRGQVRQEVADVAAAVALIGGSATCPAP